MKKYISTKDIFKLDPCKDRLDNYLKYYSSFKGTIKEFVMLENITVLDILWVLRGLKILNKKQCVHIAILCASDVLKIYENKYPKDNRPRKAIAAAKNYLNNPSKAAADASKAAYAAANAAYAAASDAANAAYAAEAAAYAAYAAEAAAYAAYAAAAYAAYAAANAAYATTKKEQENRNRKHIIKILNNVKR